MTSPITKQNEVRTSATTAGHRRDWCCGTPITGPHTPGCAYEPREDDNIYGNEAVDVPAGPHSRLVAASGRASEPPAADPISPGPAPAAPAAPKPYGLTRPIETDLDLPSGDRVRAKQLTLSHAIKLGIVDMGDAFSPQLLKDIEGDDEAKAQQVAQDVGRGFERAVTPMDKVVAAAVICPKVVLEGPSNEYQINVDDIDFLDKGAIFQFAAPRELQSAALEAQQESLKSVRGEQDPGA